MNAVARPILSRWSRLDHWRRLVALCVGANLIETGLVMGFDHGTRPDLAPQASAVAPFGVFADLRWVSVYHNSWFVFALEIAAMLVVRSALTAYSIHLAWPPSFPSPSLRRSFARALIATAFAAFFLAPSVALLFGLAAVPISWLFLAAVPAALLIALILHPVAVSSDWWRRLLSMRSLAWMLASFVVLSASTAVMANSPPGLWPLISALAGLFNAWSWVGLVHGVVDRRPARFVVPVVPIALLALIGGVIGGAVLGFVHAHPQRQGVGPVGHGPHKTGPPMLIVAGYGSTWDGRSRHPIPGAYLEQQFSYRGLGPNGEPLSYRSADTVKPLPDLDRLLLSQIALLHARTRMRVDVVAESEGALVAKTALLARNDASVDTLVLASPIEVPGRVSYPINGGQGWGVATSAVMRLLGAAFQGVSPVNLSPDSAFLVSLNKLAPSLQSAMGCPLPGIRQFALLPLADATVTPSGEQLDFDSVVVPAFHGGLLESPSTQRIVAQVLSHLSVGEDPFIGFAHATITSAAAAWQVPALVASDYPRNHEPIPGHDTCDQVSLELGQELEAKSG